MKRDDELTMGGLSPAEEALGETDSQRALRESMQDKHYEAQQLRLWHEHELQTLITAGVVPDWEMVRMFGMWTAREYYLNRKLEEMGWPI